MILTKPFDTMQEKMCSEIREIPPSKNSAVSVLIQ